MGPRAPARGVAMLDEALGRAALDRLELGRQLGHPALGVARPGVGLDDRQRLGKDPTGGCGSVAATSLPPASSSHTRRLPDRAAARP